MMLKKGTYEIGHWVYESKQVQMDRSSSAWYFSCTMPRLRLFLRIPQADATWANQMRMTATRVIHTAGPYVMDTIPSLLPASWCAVASTAMLMMNDNVAKREARSVKTFFEIAKMRVALGLDSGLG